MKQLSVFLLLLLLACGLRPQATQAQPSGPDSLSQKLTNSFQYLKKASYRTGNWPF